MVRASRIWPDVWFGRPGALFKLPYPRNGMEKPFDRQVFQFPTGSGQYQVSSLAGGSRLRTLKWKAMHADTYALLERYWVGAAGHGPYALVDPSDRNLLTPNQSGATSLFNNTRGWSTSTGLANEGQLLSNAAGGTTQHTPYNSRSLRWNFNVAAATYCSLYPTAPYRNWAGIPIVPGLSYAYSCWARPDITVDASIMMAAKLFWLDASGTLLSSSSGGDFTMTNWMRFSAVGVAPANAVYCQPTLVVTGSTITTGASIYLEEFMLEQDTVVNDWAPGTGLRPVEIVDFSDTVPFDSVFRQGVEMTLRELAV